MNRRPKQQYVEHTWFRRPDPRGQRPQTHNDWARGVSLQDSDSLEDESVDVVQVWVKG